MESEKRKQYAINYKKEKLKRVPLDLQLTGDGPSYENLLKAAEMSGETVNGFIKKAIVMRLIALGIK